MAIQILKQSIVESLRKRHNILHDKSEDKPFYRPVDRRRTIYLEYKLDDLLGTLHESFNQKKSLKKVHFQYEKGIHSFLEELSESLSDKARSLLLKLVFTMILLVCWSLSMRFVCTEGYAFVLLLTMCAICYTIWGYRLTHLAMNWGCINNAEFETFARYYRGESERPALLFNVYQSREKFYLEVKMVGKSKTKKKTTEMLFVIREEQFEDEAEEAVNSNQDSLQEPVDSD